MIIVGIFPFIIIFNHLLLLISFSNFLVKLNKLNLILISSHPHHCHLIGLNGFRLDILKYFCSFFPIWHIFH